MIQQYTDLGQDVLLVGTEDIAARLDVPIEVVATLVDRGLFPAPVHMRPPLWVADDVEDWERKASEAGE